MWSDLARQGEPGERLYHVTMTTMCSKLIRRAIGNQPVSTELSRVNLRVSTERNSSYFITLRKFWITMPDGPIANEHTFSHLMAENKTLAMRGVIGYVLRYVTRHVTLS